MVTKRRCVWTKHFHWVISCFISCFTSYSCSLLVLTNFSFNVLPGHPVNNFMSPTLIAALTLLSNESRYSLLPTDLHKGSILCNNSFRGLGLFKLQSVICFQ